MNFIEQIALIIAAALVSYFLARHQNKKDSLLAYKTKACQDLWESLVDFLEEAYPRNSSAEIFGSYGKFQTLFYKSRSFLPESLSLKIQSLIDEISFGLKSFDLDNNVIREFNSLDESRRSREQLLRNPNINASFLNILSPLINEVPNISKEIEKEFGIKPSKAKK